MQNKTFCKSLVVGIIVLFIGAGIATGINGKLNRNDVNEKTLIKSSTIINQNVCLLNFHIFDKTDEKQKDVNLSIDAANKIYETLEELKYMIVNKPRSDETQNLKNEFVDLLNIYGLIPAGLTKDYVLSLLNPSWLKNKQKTTKTRTILSKKYLSPVVEKNVNLQQIFKNCFGKTVLNIFDKNTIISPSGKTTATASFCSISSVGEGTTLPIFLLPRPRAIAAWTAPGALTSVGELLVPKGFIAEGAQSGSMLGFTGLGLTYSLPGYIVYGFVGYALYTKVSADYIEFLPPNREPVISDENPPSGSVDIPLSLSKLSFRISDADGDLMDYTVTTEPNIGSGSGNNKKNGVYTVPISGLEWDKSYKWTVEVTDGKSIVEKVFSFFTESRPFNPYDEGWQYRKKITIDHTKVAGDLNNFPVLISVVDSDLRDKAQEDGDDILFMDGSGVANKLYHEFEQFDSSSGELVAWMKITSLSSSIDTSFYMYYGNPDCSNQQLPEKVWDNNYCSVWHMSDLKDSTSNENDGANHGTNPITGKIGDARDFEKNNHAYIDWGDMPEPANSMISTGTFEMWVKPDEQQGLPIGKANAGYDPDILSYYIYLGDDGKILFDAWRGTWYPDHHRIYTITNEAHITTNNWQHITAVVDLSIQNMDLYYNGQEKDSTKVVEGSPPTYFYDVDLTEVSGRDSDESRIFYYNGVIDEMRISKACRSFSWISTDYNNQNDPLNFLSFGLEESSP